jgi:hypothetical protein
VYAMNKVTLYVDCIKQGPAGPAAKGVWSEMVGGPSLDRSMHHFSKCMRATHKFFVVRTYAILVIDTLCVTADLPGRFNRPVEC